VVTLNPERDSVVDAAVAAAAGAQHSAPAS
jgi:hypothetical protein